MFAYTNHHRSGYSMQPQKVSHEAPMRTGRVGLIRVTLLTLMPQEPAQNRRTGLTDPPQTLRFTPPPPVFKGSPPTAMKSLT